MSSYREVVEARKSGDAEKLNEVSLGRVYQHIKRGAKKSLGIITAWRAGNTSGQNKAANKKLMNDLRSAGLGAFKLIGHWQECQKTDVSYKDCPKDQLVDTKESSFGVVGITRKMIERLAKKYGQDAVVYLGPETEGNAILVFKGGGEQKIGRFSPSKIAQAYSRVRGGSFVFEGWEYPAQTSGEALIDDGMEVIYSTK